jgi:hypothetical protein
MNFAEAIEAVKIITPYVPVLRQKAGGVEFFQTFLHALGADDPMQVVRFVALMEHRDIEEVVRDYHGQPEEFVMALTHGLTANPLPELVDMAYFLGLSKERWTNGR